MCKVVGQGPLVRLSWHIAESRNRASFPCASHLKKIPKQQLVQANAALHLTDAGLQSKCFLLACNQESKMAIGMCVRIQGVKKADGSRRSSFENAPKSPQTGMVRIRHKSREKTPGVGTGFAIRQRKDIATLTWQKRVFVFSSQQMLS